MTTLIAELKPQDQITQDPAPIARIFREMGPDAAEKAVNRAVGELTLSIAALSRLVAERDLADVPRQLRRIARMSDHLGMTSLSTIAADAEACTARDDATAFSAVWARLLRVAASQLSQGGELRDRRG